MDLLTTDTLAFAVSADGVLTLERNQETDPVPVVCQPLFPVSQPGEFIAVSAKDDAGSDRQIGIIRALKDLPEAQRELVMNDLRLAHFLPAIVCIRSIRSIAKGQRWDVNTDRGERTFVVRNSRENSALTVKDVIIVTDIHGFRYRIPGLESLDRKSLNELQKAQI